MNHIVTNHFRTEKPCNRLTCPPGFYLCHRDNYCISSEFLCDGIHHCYLGDDEINCGSRHQNKTK